MKTRQAPDSERQDLEQERALHRPVRHPGPVPSPVDTTRMFVEVFCGLARLSVAARNAFFALLIDYQSKHMA